MIFSCPLALSLEIQNEIKADTHQFYFSKSSKYSNISGVEYQSSRLGLGLISKTDDDV